MVFVKKISVNMEMLPVEIIELIFCDPILSMRDIVNFSSSCKKLRKIITNSNVIWKHKYYESWPTTDVHLDSSIWYSECVTRKKFEQETLKFLSKLSAELYHVDIKNIGSDQLNCVNDLLNAHSYGYYYLRDFLLNIISLPISQSLTKKYYANILLKFIKKQHYHKVWNDLLHLHPEKQIIEKGAIFVSQWIQITKHGIPEMVISDLNYTADLVKQYLLQNEKNHPLKDISEETLLNWRENNIPGNIFEPSDCFLILSSINDVLFNDLKYHIIFDFFEIRRKHFGMDFAVLDKRATPLLFCIIFESIARRLGVKVEILDFLDKFLLGWKVDYNAENSPYYYLHLGNSGLSMRSCLCQAGLPLISNMFTNNMKQVAMKNTFDYCLSPLDLNEDWFSIIDSLELALLIKPHNVEWYQRISRFCMLHEMDSKDIIKRFESLRLEVTEDKWNILKPTFQSLKAYQKNWNYENRSNHKYTVRKRSKDINFAVGMIVRDCFLDYRGVIYGWDKKCQQGESFNSEIQPCYKVLVDGGSTEYVPQHSLEILHSPPFISHPLTGRFFEEYCTTYYKPNKELEKEYPEDTAALFRILKKARGLESC